MVQIITYTLSWCTHCNALKEFLKEKEIKFKNIDVEENEDAGNDIVEKTGQGGFPVIEIDGIYLVGFNRQKILEVLKL